MSKMFAKLFYIEILDADCKSDLMSLTINSKKWVFRTLICFVYFRKSNNVLYGKTVFNFNICKNRLVLQSPTCTALDLSLSMDRPPRSKDWLYDCSVLNMSRNPIYTGTQVLVCRYIPTQCCYAKLKKYCFHCTFATNFDINILRDSLRPTSLCQPIQPTSTTHIDFLLYTA